MDFLLALILIVIGWTVFFFILYCVVSGAVRNGINESKLFVKDEEASDREPSDFD